MSLLINCQVLAHVACAFSPTDVEDDKVGLEGVQPCAKVMLSFKFSRKLEDAARFFEKVALISQKEILWRLWQDSFAVFLIHR